MSEQFWPTDELANPQGPETGQVLDRPDLSEEQIARLSNAERYFGFPNARFSLQGVNDNGDIVMAKSSGARKEYRCPHCEDLINETHIVITTLTNTRHNDEPLFDHDHVHTAECGPTIINSLHDVEVIPAAASKDKALQAKKNGKFVLKRRISREEIDAGLRSSA